MCVLLIDAMYLGVDVGQRIGDDALVGGDPVTQLTQRAHRQSGGERDVHELHNGVLVLSVRGAGWR
ncbi:hypothetical protein ASG56_05980 [Rhodococcus sp. Leaf7]|nr:hypothetical protein ASG56_05980 [Rhodococcus sp. Leaf7]KQU42615.1 hypothetical protein ASG64_05980 [Rhodococcus sp. Leaf247]